MVWQIYTLTGRREYLANVLYKYVESRQKEWFSGAE